MIIRILGEGQYEVDEADLDRLNALDTELQEAVEAGTVPRFVQALDALLGAVRTVGIPVPEAMLVGSDLVLPAGDASLDEVVALLGDEGLIPG